MTEQKKKPGIIKIIFGGLVIVALLFILGLMVSIINDDTETNESVTVTTVQTNKTVAKNKSVKKKTIDDKISDIVNKQLGKKNNLDKKTIIKVSSVKSSEKGNIVNLDLNASENLTSKMTKGGMTLDAKRILEPISKLKDVDSIQLQWYYPLVDNYGNKKDKPVMRINLSHDTLKKIKWDNFDHKKFKTIADSYWESEALNK